MKPRRVARIEQQSTATGVSQQGKQRRHLPARVAPVRKDQARPAQPATPGAEQLGAQLHRTGALDPITAGGKREAYCPEGYNNFTIRMLLAPIEQTVNLCKMIFLPPFVIHGTHSISQDDLTEYRMRLGEIITILQDDFQGFTILLDL